MNYLGDWGKQYGVLAVGFERFGDEKTLAENPISHLYDVYVKISSMSKAEDDIIKAKRTQIQGLQVCTLLTFVVDHLC